MVAHLTQKPEVPDSTYFHFSFHGFDTRSSADFKKGSCQFLAKVHALSTGQPLRRSEPAQNIVVRLTDLPNITISVDRGN